MRIGKPTLDAADVAAALTTPSPTPRPPRSPHVHHTSHSPRLTAGLPLSDRRVLLYLIGPNSSFQDCFAHAGAMAQTLSDGLTIALVCQSDYPYALEEFGLEHWDQIVYLADRRMVLAWPIGADRPGSESPLGPSGQA